MASHMRTIHILQTITSFLIIFLSILLLAIGDLDEPAYRAGEAVLSLCVAVLSLLFVTVQLLRKRPTRSKVLLILNILLGGLSVWMFINIVIVNVSHCAGLGCGLSSWTAGMFGIAVILFISSARTAYYNIHEPRHPAPEFESTFRCDTDAEIESLPDSGPELTTPPSSSSLREQSQHRNQSHNQNQKQTQEPRRSTNRLVPTPEEPEAEARAERQERVQKETKFMDVVLPPRRSWGILVPEGKVELAGFSTVYITALYVVDIRSGKPREPAQQV
ncbi:uncharacterized protein BDV14DRAFT_202496 [Aspergillus stella-maris]|uniref:uncharacterized protein n=1 Tax=Aspergillus stella-maris TaxID=1810926 RepID=UPI003CCCC086